MTSPRASASSASAAHRPQASDGPPLGVVLSRRRLLTIAVLIAALTSTFMAVSPLRRALDLIAHMDLKWIAAAVALEFASCVSFLVIFRRFFDAMPAKLARRLAWAEMGSGALLPGGGVGAFAVGGWMLHTVGMPTDRIVRRSSGLFFLTSAANLIAMFLAAALLLIGVTDGPHDVLWAGLPALSAIALIAAGLSLPRIGEAQISRSSWLCGIAEGLNDAKRELIRPTWRLLGAAGYLGFDIAVLGAALAAVGHPPPIPALVLAYLIGYLANLIPVPGGIGVLEGGLAAALVIYGVPATEAAAAVLAYHAIAFWIPSLGGLIAYKLFQRSAEELTAPQLRRPGSEMQPTARGESGGCTDAGSSPIFGADCPPSGIEAAPSPANASRASWGRAQAPSTPAAPPAGASSAGRAIQRGRLLARAEQRERPRPTPRRECGPRRLD